MKGALALACGRERGSEGAEGCAAAAGAELGSAASFPMSTRMVGLEVFKGPAAIQHGPHTVGGAINLVSRRVPSAPGGEIDVAVGLYETARAHAWGAVGDGGPWDDLATFVHAAAEEGYGGVEFPIFVLDAEGRIRATNLRGDRLSAFVRELVGASEGR